MTTGIIFFELSQVDDRALCWKHDCHIVQLDCLKAGLIIARNLLSETENINYWGATPCIFAFGLMTFTYSGRCLIQKGKDEVCVCGGGFRQCKSEVRNYGLLKFIGVYFGLQG
jgi:hypothetical protein